MLTVAIPFYNASRYLDEAIESVFNQTYHNWQLILLDDGSTDNSLEIANKYLSDPRVKVFSDGENKNLGFRLNQIPSLVNTEFLARMDADDIMHPQRLEKQLNVLIANPTIDVLGTNAYSIDDNNLVFGIRGKYNSCQTLNKVSSFIHPSIMAKTKWFKQNPYDVKAVRIEDAELWLRTSHVFQFYQLSLPLLFYREFGINYYKKYSGGYKALFYMLKKHNYSFRVCRFVLKYFFSGFIFYIFNLVGKESILLKRRNVINLPHRDLIEFLDIDVR
jgi:glycosyltransferase involved in cell wall biosynthesis